jgi:hypothetical protein
MLIEPFNNTAVHVSSCEKFRVRQHHSEQQSLNPVNAASPLDLRALQPRDLNPAEKTPVILLRLEESTLYIVPVDFENSPGNYVIGHARSSHGIA